MTTAIIRYDDKSLYNGEVDDDMIPHGHGIWYSDIETISGEWNRGFCGKYNIHITKPLRGYKTCYTTIEDHIFEYDNKTSFGLLTGYFVKGILTRYGKFVRNEVIMELMFVNGEKHGRAKTIMTYDPNNIQQHYTYYTHNVANMINRWITNDDDDIAYVGDYAGYGYAYCYDTDKHHISKEKITNKNIVRFCNTGTSHTIGQSEDSYEGARLGVWRIVYINGIVKFGNRNNNPQRYDIDGTVAAGMW